MREKAGGEGRASEWEKVEPVLLEREWECWKDMEREGGVERKREGGVERGRERGRARERAREREREGGL